MQLVNIQILAFTPSHTLPWRVYLYTHTQAPPCTTLILGELLYTGKPNEEGRAQDGTRDDENMKKTVAGGQTEKKVNNEEENASGIRNSGELAKESGQIAEIKVTLKQQPKDDKALRGFLSVLITVLHTLSSERE